MSGTHMMQSHPSDSSPHRTLGLVLYTELSLRITSHDFDPQRHTSTITVPHIFLTINLKCKEVDMQGNTQSTFKEQRLIGRRSGNCWLWGAISKLTSKGRKRTRICPALVEAEQEPSFSSYKKDNALKLSHIKDLVQVHQWAVFYRRFSRFGMLAHQWLWYPDLSNPWPGQASYNGA